MKAAPLRGFTFVQGGVGLWLLLSYWSFILFEQCGLNNFKGEVGHCCDC